MWQWCLESLPKAIWNNKVMKEGLLMVETQDVILELQQQEANKSMTMTGEKQVCATPLAWALSWPPFLREL